MKIPEYLNPRRFGLVVILALLFLGLIVFRGYQQRRLDREAVEVEKVAVRVAAPQTRTFTDQVSFVGNLEAREQAAVVAKLPGKTVLKVLVDIGSPVRAGQLLAILDDSHLRPQVAQAKASVAKAQAFLDQAKTQLETVQKDYERYDQLYSEKVISGQQLDHARGQFNLASAGQRLAGRQLDEARSGLRQLEITMGYHEIRSPISGIVAGRFIDPGDTSSAENPAFLVNRQERVKVTGAVPEAGFTKLRVGQPATVTLDALGGRAVKAKIARLSPVIDPGTRTGTAELVLDADPELKPGMYAKVALHVGSHQGMGVPREAVNTIPGTGQKRVFLALDGKAQSRAIATGAESREYLEVTEGLSPEDVVILTQSVRIGEGTPVEVVKP